MKSSSIRKLVFAAMLSAITFAATFISFPTGLGGNVNLGDAILLVGVSLLGDPLSAIACALGAALTDLLSGYAIYAPATFLIKALMGLLVLLILRLSARMPAVVGSLLAWGCAECVMILGYFTYEWILFSLPVAAVGIPFNLIQAVASILLAALLRALLTKARLWDTMK